MRPFGVLHFSILAAILAVAIVLARLSRSGTIDPRRLRYALAAFLALNELIRYLHDGFQWLS